MGIYNMLRLTDPKFLVYCNHLRDRSYDEVRKQVDTFTTEAYQRNRYGFSGGFFNGAGAADAKVTAPNNSGFQGLFNGGGAISFNIRADSDGEGSAARLVSKANEYFIYLTGEASGRIKIGFYHYFSTTNGQWVSTSTVLPVGKDSHVVITGDMSSVSNDPVIFVNKKYVALTESSTPVGSASSNTNAFIIGNVAEQTTTHDGLIYGVKVHKFNDNTIMTWDEVLQLQVMSELGL